MAIFNTAVCLSYRWCFLSYLNWLKIKKIKMRRRVGLYAHRILGDSSFKMLMLQLICNVFWKIPKPFRWCGHCIISGYDSYITMAWLLNRTHFAYWSKVNGKMRYARTLWLHCHYFFQRSPLLPWPNFVSHRLGPPYAAQNWFPQKVPYNGIIEKNTVEWDACQLLKRPNHVFSEKDTK